MTMKSQTLTERTLLEKIAQCDAIMARTKPIVERPNQIPSWFITGAANRPRSLDRALDAENNRRSKAFNQYEKARQNKNLYEFQLNQLRTGGTSPEPETIRRNSRNQYRRKMATAGRAVFEVGMKFRIAFNPAGGVLEVKQINRTTVTDIDGDTWRYDEIIPEYIWQREVTAVSLANTGGSVICLEDTDDETKTHRN